MVFYVLLLMMVSVSALDPEESHVDREYKTRTRAGRQPCGKEVRAFVENGHPRFIKVLGLFNSGTNYARTLMDLNGLDVALRDLPDCERQTQEACSGSALGWKHADPDVFGAREMPMDNRTFPLIMVRHPFMWIRSTTKRKYKMYNCVTKPLRSCNYAWEEQCGLGYVTLRSNYTNFILAWGEHFSRIIARLPPTAAVYVRYEDLVVNWTSELSRIRSHALRRGVACTERCVNENWRPLEHDGRTFSPHTHALVDAKKKITHENDGNLITKLQAARLCNDTKTMRMMEYFHYTTNC